MFEYFKKEKLPKFKVGDKIQSADAEEWEKDIYKILKVGKTKYLVEGYSRWDGSPFESTMNQYHIDRYYEVIE